MLLRDFVAQYPWRPSSPDPQRTGPINAVRSWVEGYRSGGSGRQPPSDITLQEFRQWLDDGRAAQIRNLGAKGIAVWKEIIDGLIPPEPRVARAVNVLREAASIRGRIADTLECEGQDRQTAERLADAVVKALEEG